MTIQSITVVDDDPLIRELIAETLAEANYDVHLFANPVSALERFSTDPTDVVFTDLVMPQMTGLELIPKLRQASPNTMIFLMTAHHTMDRAVEAIRLGAEDYISKPFTPAQIEVLLAKAAERRRLVQENNYLRNEICGDDRELVVGRNEQMLDLLHRIQKVAASKASVLIQGETGTGKELIARAIHRASDRADKPFIKVNCAALAENLLESELFGHEKGAFTGAEARREGRFELAHGGTILLDEIGEISPRLQAKLLRVLEEEEFERVGGAKTIKVDVRVISTTNRNLNQEILENHFREDLFYRLNVVPLRVPPLRERTEDIPVLASHFLDLFSKANARPASALTPSTIRKLQAYSWPGNVRELRNLTHRSVVMDNTEINVPNRLQSEAQAPAAAPGIVGRTIEDVERELILKTLAQTGGNKTTAADILGVTPRTLRNKLSRYRAEGLRIPLAVGA